jgi:hypothetical protein
MTCFTLLNDGIESRLHAALGMRKDIMTGGKGTGRQDLSRELLPVPAPTTIILFPSF